jgi:glycosyltransferase involved in cell wall biosynthesis
MAHGFVFNEATGLKRKILVWLERRAAKRADKIIAVSEFDRQSAITQKVTPPEKITTIHHGLDLEFFKNLKVDTAALRREFNILLNAALIGVVANFYKTKGLKFLIDAAALVVKKIPEAHFIILGEGKLRPKLERQIQKFNLQNKIILTGFRHDAIEIMAAVDVFVLSSLKEGLPFALLEAGALGKPIVATRVGGVPEIIDHGKNGLLVPPSDANALAAAIFSLLQDKKTAEQLGLSLQEKIFKNFDLKTTLEKTTEVYSDLANGY